MSWSIWFQGKKEVVERELTDVQDAAYASLRRIDDMSGEIAVSIGGHGSEDGGSYSVSVTALPPVQTGGQASGSALESASKALPGAENK